MEDGNLDMTTLAVFVASLDNLDNNPLYLEKKILDDEGVCEDEPKRVCNQNRESARNRNRKHKKKLIRRFLSQKPTMDLTELYGCRPESGWYVALDIHDDYSINPITHVYLSQRGDVRVLHGAIPMHCNRVFQLSSRKEIKALAKVTNRKIRHTKINEDTPLQYSYYKKLVEKSW
ncbi:hypothetical protein [Butyrivibrio sp. AE2032]|uniref:hypothetical protein n=1 Tax=Butyrivibrio sp. AE2032 TaxID=1458463 RepID=UPI0005511BF3|nr:hypothetical protein [Butyrivibrio sp. AE2032]